ncbi:MAG: hypothetical protein BWZ08_00864 [candidate division BRC1 bacterium ADurb.BinA292]|nr:MAG: hypothetical protein BWZ08_00864 [candidate division BRC1 bacterium ADurb.BinA292]
MGVPLEVLPRILTPLGALLIVMLTGCARQQIIFVNAQHNRLGEPRLTVHQPGHYRVSVRRMANAPPWQDLVLRNDGRDPVDEIRLWGLGGADLLDVARPAGAEPPSPDPLAEPAPRSVLKPFRLMPGERFVCGEREIDGDMHLQGAFLWAMGGDNTRILSAADTLRNARSGRATPIVLDPSSGEAYVQWTFSSPLPHLGGMLSWEVDPPGARPEVWISVDRGVWGRLPNPRGGHQWAQPVDLTSSIEGYHEFSLRLLFAPDSVGVESEDGTITLRKIYLERPFGGRGELREWRPGLNELEFAFRAHGNAQLTVELLNAP